MSYVKPQVTVEDSLGGEEFWVTSLKKRRKPPITINFSSRWIETIIIEIDSNYVSPAPRELFDQFFKPVLNVSNIDILHAFQNDLIKELGVHLNDIELSTIRESLLSWIDFKAECQGLQFNVEAKKFLINLLVLVMKKADKMVKEFEEE